LSACWAVVDDEFGSFVKQIAAIFCKTTHALPLSQTLCLRFFGLQIEGGWGKKGYVLRRRRLHLRLQLSWTNMEAFRTFAFQICKIKPLRAHSLGHNAYLDFTSFLIVAQFYSEKTLLAILKKIKCIFRFY
jgi:hypothetical protein